MFLLCAIDGRFAYEIAPVSAVTVPQGTKISMQSWTTLVFFVCLSPALFSTTFLRIRLDILHCLRLHELHKWLCNVIQSRFMHATSIFEFHMQIALVFQHGILLAKNIRMFPDSCINRPTEQQHRSRLNQITKLQNVVQKFQTQCTCTAHFKEKLPSIK